MGKSGKPNPRRRPATMADIERAKKETALAVAQNTMTIYLYSAHDLDFFTDDQLQELLARIEKVSAMVEEGYLTMADMRNVLKQERGLEGLKW